MISLIHRKGIDTFILINSRFDGRLRESCCMNGLMTIFYLFIGILLLSIAILLDPNVSEKILQTVIGVHLYLGICFFIISIIVRNYGLAIILSISSLYGITLLGQAIFYGIILLSGLFLALHLRSLPSIHWRQYLPALIIVCGAGIFLGLMLLSSNVGQCDFLIEKRMMSSGIIPDILFHSAIVSMIRNFGEVSIGLHGYETHIAYHVFSHRILASIASLHGISSLTAYGYVYLINLAPLLFLAILACAEDALPSLDPIRFCFRPILLSLLLGGIWALPITKSFYLLDNYLVSQSYNLGLTLLLASISCTFSRNLPLSVHGMGLGLVLASMSKISTGAVGICLYFVEMWRHRHFLSRKNLLFCGVVAAIVGCLVLRMSRGNDNVHGGGLAFVLFQHLTSYMELPEAWTSVAYFFGGHFLLSWFAVALCGFARWGISKNHTGENRFDEFEIFLLANIIGIGIGSLAVSFFKAAAAAFFYFSNISMILALPAILIVWLNPAVLKLTIPRFRWLFMLGGSTVAFLCLISTVHYSLPKMKGTLERLHEEIKIKETAAGAIGPYLKGLQEIRKMDYHKRFLIYIPKKEKDFWTIDGVSSPFAGFYIPAIAERPALFGMPYHSDSETMTLWGLGDYMQRKGLQIEPDSIEESVLLGEAKKMRFYGYVTLEKNRMSWHSVSKN